MHTHTHVICLPLVQLSLSGSLTLNDTFSSCQDLSFYVRQLTFFFSPLLQYIYLFISFLVRVFVPFHCIRLTHSVSVCALYTRYVCVSFVSFISLGGMVFHDVSLKLKARDKEYTVAILFLRLGSRSLVLVLGPLHIAPCNFYNDNIRIHIFGFVRCGPR